MRFEMFASAVAAVFLSATVATPASAQCITHHVEGSGTASPTIILTNHCNQRIYYNLCTRKTNDFRNLFPGYTAPGGRSRHTLWLARGQGYTFRYNWSVANYPSAAAC